MDNLHYDVFISCKSEDYGYAEEIYTFLTTQGLKVFLASVELRELGDSEYREVIEQAIEHSNHLIVFASKPEYVLSKYVKYEWGLFVEGKLDGSISGNIITVLKGIKPRDITLALRKYQSIDFKEYENSLLYYLKTGELEEDKKRDKSSHKKRIKLPGWLIATLYGIGAFIAVYILFFSIGYGYAAYVDQKETNPRVELNSHVIANGPIITYNNNGITAIYDAEARKVRNISVNKREFEITGPDFWRAASITGGFAIWASNLKYIKNAGNGKSVFAIAVGSFFGTLFGYSTGKYIATQNNKTAFQKEMEEYLRDTQHWIGIQQEYDERKALGI